MPKQNRETHVLWWRLTFLCSTSSKSCKHNFTHILSFSDVCSKKCFFKIHHRLISDPATHVSCSKISNTDWSLFCACYVQNYTSTLYERYLEITPVTGSMWTWLQSLVSARHFLFDCAASKLASFTRNVPESMCCFFMSKIIFEQRTVIIINAKTLSLIITEITSLKKLVWTLYIC